MLEIENISTTTIVVIGIVILVGIIWLGFKVLVWDEGDNFGAGSILILILVFIGALISLFFAIPNITHEGYSVGNIIILLIPICLFGLNLFKVFRKNNLFIGLLILFYQMLLVIISPILIYFVIQSVKAGEEIFKDFFKSWKLGFGNKKSGLIH